MPLYENAEFVEQLEKDKIRFTSTGRSICSKGSVSLISVSFVDLNEQLQLHLLRDEIWNFIL